ncbi:hypothetical protein N7488_003440 [Penicillium malachiteum]|nr:hypothetical protein N7488_003440 [Penicillium malachiteum]
MDFIEKIPGFTKGNVRRAMGVEILNSVNDAYSKILNRSPNVIKARRLLHIIIAVKCPLLVEELSLALAVQKSNQSDEEIQEEIEPVERFRVMMRDLCGLLLVIIERKVYLLHQTVKEFLVLDTSSSDSLSISHTWQNSFKPMESSKVLAEMCTWVLCADPGTSHQVLWDYFVRYCMEHLCEACSEKEEEITKLGAILCSPQTRQGTRLRDIVCWERLPISESSSALIVATYFGLVKVVEFLLDFEETNVDSMDLKQRTSLSWAAEYGHEAVAKLLLQTGRVDIDSKDSNNQTPLSWAAENGHADVVELLLQTGKAAINFKDSKYEKPLSWAAKNGHGAVVKLLLQTEKADINSKDLRQRTPLSWAAINGHEDAVELLLQTGNADINSKDLDQKNASSTGSGKVSHG